MAIAQKAGFLTGYIMFTTVLSTILILTNRIDFKASSILIVVVITAAITITGTLLKTWLQ